MGRATEEHNVLEVICFYFLLISPNKIQIGYKLIRRDVFQNTIFPASASVEFSFDTPGMRIFKLILRAYLLPYWSYVGHFEPEDNMLHDNLLINGGRGLGVRENSLG